MKTKASTIALLSLFALGLAHPAKAVPLSLTLDPASSANFYFGTVTIGTPGATETPSLEFDGARIGVFGMTEYAYFDPLGRYNYELYFGYTFSYLSAIGHTFAGPGGAFTSDMAETSYAAGTETVLGNYSDDFRSWDVITGSIYIPMIWDGTTMRGTGTWSLFWEQDSAPMSESQLLSSVTQQVPDGGITAGLLSIALAGLISVYHSLVRKQTAAIG
jgi:hypothetical protein